MSRSAALAVKHVAFLEVFRHRSPVDGVYSARDAEPDPRTGRRKECVVKRSCAFIVLAFMLAALPTFADHFARRPASRDLTAEADRLADREFGSDGPGAAIIVVKGGKTLLRKGYGLADV